MTATVDKNVVKEALRELIREDPEVFRNLLKEIINESALSSDDEFDQLMQRNFQKFDATFKALA